jgi:hypothetical protein
VSFAPLSRREHVVAVIVCGLPFIYLLYGAIAGDQYIPSKARSSS